MNISHQQDDTGGLITLIVRCLIGALILLLICSTALLTTSCALTIAPDGTKTVTIDSQQAIRAVEIIAEK